MCAVTAERPTPLLELVVTCIRSVARHQADTEACLVTEEDRSGRYCQVNESTLYCPARSAYLSLSAEGMQKALHGVPLRVSSAAFS